VVTGFYRYVRNPMYVGVLAIILGQALLFADAGPLWLSAILWIAFHLFVIGYEEPALSHTFGDNYARFRDSVPRWLPRLRPWRP
jgi:protein-S-isoprenylcysteine O-methyltransferase Ste14